MGRNRGRVINIDKATTTADTFEEYEVVLDYNEIGKRNKKGNIKCLVIDDILDYSDYNAVSADGDEYFYQFCSQEKEAMVEGTDQNSYYRFNLKYRHEGTAGDHAIDIEPRKAPLPYGGLIIPTQKLFFGCDTDSVGATFTFRLRVFWHYEYINPNLVDAIKNQHM